VARIVVGIGGGIAAYKLAEVVSRLVQSGHECRVVLTAGARHFVGPATFAALCGAPPAEETYDARFPLGAHIELAAGSDLLLVAPATARLLASFAGGLADDLLATLYLQVRCPVLIAPAMSDVMWSHPAVQRNVRQLSEDGVHWIGPDSGWLSCRQQGTGRLSQPEAILQAITQLLPP
jgi:phosphopantothenoylcysteine decarboxylase